MARVVELRRQEAEARQQPQDAAEREEQERVDARIDDIGRMVDDLKTALLVAEGFHLHNRQWRRASWM